MNWVAKWNSFCDRIFVPKRSVTLTIFMYYWIDSENYSCTIDYPLGCICVLLFMPYWNFEYTKAVTLHCGKSGKSGRQYRSWNWGNPFWVKLTSSFFQCRIHYMMHYHDFLSKLFLGETEIEQWPDTFHHRRLHSNSTSRASDADLLTKCTLIGQP